MYQIYFADVSNGGFGTDGCTYVALKKPIPAIA